MYKGLGDILIAFCKMKIASVVDLLDLKPNWQFEIMFSYVSRILDITIDIIIFEQVAIIERPLYFFAALFDHLLLIRHVIDEINQEKGKIKEVHTASISNIK